MALILEIQTAGGTTQLRTLQPGTNTLVTEPGARYQLRDSVTGKVSPGIRALRQGNDLVIDQIEGDGSGSSQEQTQGCVSQTRAMDQALQSIAERMSAIKSMADQVAHAAQEQISVSQGVARHIAGIADVAYETEREARESAGSSEVLAELVAKQQQLIAHFKV